MVATHEARDHVGGRLLGSRRPRGRDDDGVERGDEVEVAGRRHLGVPAHLDGDSAFTFCLLHGREEHRAAALEEEFARAWRSDLGPELRRTVP